MPLPSEVVMLHDGLENDDGNQTPVSDYSKWDVRDGENRVTEIHTSGTIGGNSIHLKKTFTNYRIENGRQVCDESDWTEVV